MGIGFSPLMKKSSDSWSSYWSSHLFGEDDLNFRARSRSGLSLVDDFGNNASILTPTFLSSAVGHEMRGDKTRTAEHIFDGVSHSIYLRFKVINDVPASGFGTPSKMLACFGSIGAGRGFGVIVTNNKFQVYVSDGTNEKVNGFFNNLVGWVSTPINTTIKNGGWCDMIFTMDIATHILQGFIYDSAGNQISMTENMDLSTWTFNTSDNAQPYYFAQGQITVCNLRKFTGVKTIAQCRDKTYITDIEFDIPDLISGTDISGNNMHLTRNLITKADRTYSDYMTHLLDYGYSKYRLADKPDIDIPNTVAGTAVVNNLLEVGYVKVSDHPGNSVSHNFADSAIDFAGDDFDRSDAAIYSDDARAATTHYDAANVKRWHISELNQALLHRWKNTGYKGKSFVHAYPNSCDEDEGRSILTEIFSYNTDNTGDDYEKILQFTADRTIVIGGGYLFNPYNEVFKVTALKDSEFHLNINDSIVYSKQDIWDKIDAMIKLNPSEDKVTSIMNWLIPHSNPINTYMRTREDSSNILFDMNCFPDGHCGPVSLLLYNVLEHYYPGENFGYANDWHSTGRQTNFFVELYMWLIAYKGKYTHANFNELISDPKLFIEPLRNTMHEPAVAAFNYYTSYIFRYLKSVPRNTLYEYISLQDNLTMKLPSGSNMIFPVLSTDVPDFYNVTGWTNKFASAIVTSPAGTTGEISMPFVLTVIKGTGTISVKGNNYTLPADEATVRSLFQDGSRGIDSVYTFTILTNTGGIVSEYLVNRARIRLYNNNEIRKGIISGDVTVEPITTAMPLPYVPIGVDKGTAECWTLYFDKWFTSNKSVKTPLFIDTNSINLIKVTFNKSGGKKPRPVSSYVNEVKVLTAGTPVIDQCFASILTPRSDYFSDSLELTFTSVDESDTYYTLDGSTPDATKTKYTTPFTISATTTIKWINIKTDYADSHINSRTILKGVGPELVDQDNWYLPSYYDSFSPHWSNFMADLKADGNDGTALKNGFFTVGKKYRIEATVSITSGTAFAISDGITYPFVLNTSGNLVVEYVAQGAGLRLMSFVMSGTLTKLSIREVL